MSVDISGLDKAKVLAALYNAARPQGLGFMHYKPTQMTVEEARRILASGQTYFDYLAGRVMKVDLSSDSVDPWGFDRDNGDGAVQRIIETLRASGNVTSPAILDQHMAGTRASLQDAREHLGDPTIVRGPAVQLGLGDTAGRLKPKLDEAEEALG